MLFLQVNGYIDPKDFGLNGTWCPLVYGQEQLGCQRPTLQQLLQMASGLLPADNGACGVPGVNSTWNATDWYYKFRCDSLPTPPEQPTPLFESHHTLCYLPARAHRYLPSA